MADPVILLNMLAAGKIGPHRQIRGVKGGARMRWMLMIAGLRSAQIKYYVCLQVNISCKCNECYEWNSDNVVDFFIKIID